ANRTVRHGHSRQINLVHVDDSAHGAVLPNDFAQQAAFKVEDFSTSHFGIEEYFFGNIWFNHCFVPRARLTRALPGQPSESASTGYCANRLPIVILSPYLRSEEHTSEL